MTQIHNDLNSLTLFMVQSLLQTLKNVNLSIKQAQLSQQVGTLFSSKLQSQIGEMNFTQFEKQPNKVQQKQVMNLLQINKLCFDNLVKIIEQSPLQPLTHDNFEMKKGKQRNDDQLLIQDYESLQQAVQKAQQQVRKHIGIQHQMKICLQEVQQQLSELLTDNQSLRKELTFLKKQLSISKKQQLQTLQKLHQAQEKITYFENNLKINDNSNKNDKKGTKIHTQPSSSYESNHLLLTNETSRKSLKKPFNSHKQKQQQQYYHNLKNNSKRPILTKMLAQSNKLGSKKQSKLIVMDSNDIESIGLSSFITLSMQKQKGNPTIESVFNKNHQTQNKINNNNSNKQMFWNKRLKKKHSTTVHGLYSDMTTVQHSNNRSLNISPKQLKKKQKQQQLKDAYAINVRDIKKQSIIGQNNQETTVMKRQHKQASYLNGYNNQLNKNNGKNAHIRRNIRTQIDINGTVDRSKSMAYCC